MTGPERRHTPRSTLFPYTTLFRSPNNGGIVLNVSDGGLCFHSFDPVPRNGKVRFWFSDNGQRIEADATLAWTDEKQTGGLRFAALPTEAREKIRDWVDHPAPTPTADVRSSRVPWSSAFPSLAGGSYDKGQDKGKNQGKDKKAVPVDSASLIVASPGVKVPLPSSAFSRGLVTGLMIAAVAVAAILFHDYRRQFGETLIELGERFAAKPQPQTTAVSATSPAALPVAQAVSTAPRASEAAPATPPPPAPAVPATLAPEPAVAASPSRNIPSPPERRAPEPVGSSVKFEPAKPVSTADVAAPSTAAGDLTSKMAATHAAPATSSESPTMAPSTTALVAVATSADATGPTTAAISAPDSNKPGAAPKLEVANQPGIHTEGGNAANADSRRELYFEVGKFKNVFQARDETDRLAQLGFPVTSVEKGHLWSNSVHVLVGPYGDEDQAKATHENLLTNGFKPRPFEKGWRNFTLVSSVMLNGARTPEGDYIVSWESYIGDASVKFLRNHSVVASADGRWVKRDVKYPHDAYMYRRNPDGSRTLLEIHFGGMRQALVFGKG